jgi:hypothetical protein
MEHESAERRLRTPEVIAIGLFLLANLIVPLTAGELYPFTIAPMFSDRPVQYCDYRVWAPDGTELPLQDFELQRNYDGNPVGMGAGVQPPPTLDEFGTAPDETTLRRHVGRVLQHKHAHLAYVDVQQEVIGPIDADRVGVIHSIRIRIMNDAK